MTATETTDVGYTAYYAARRRVPFPRSGPHSAASPPQALRHAMVDSNGSHCHICHAHKRLRPIITRDPAWEAQVTRRAHAAIAGTIPLARRLAIYACAAASPRAALACPACTPVTRLRKHLERLLSAAHDHTA